MIQDKLERNISFALEKISIISDGDKLNEDNNGLSTVSDLNPKVL